LHYTALTAASAALVVGIGVSLLHARHQWFGRGLVVVVTALAVVSAISVVGRRQELAFPHQAFSAAAPPGCVAADDPTALIEMDRLSSDLRAGCRVPVDVTGINYDRLHRVVDGQSVKRRFNLAWQHFIVRYLTSGTSFVIDRPWGDELNAVSRHELDQMPPIAAADNLVLRRVISKHP
ncbi:MAG TPA: hypothetical protein VME70_08150, partial [Mycobacteriales bacterium]|nr:hypothetical protein [Mycobacteriales bacterium]